MPQPGLKPKDLVGIPWRVAFALQDDGWWLRRDHIWAKPNPMPESVRDRCTTAHEYLFLLTKSARYYYDGEAIKEPFAVSAIGDTRHAAHGPDKASSRAAANGTPRIGQANRNAPSAQQALGLDGCHRAVSRRAFRDVSAGADRALHPRRLPGRRHGARPVSRRRDDGAGRRPAGAALHRPRAQPGLCGDGARPDRRPQIGAARRARGGVMALRCTVPRLEAALGMEPTSARCACGELVFAPGWWCDDCNACAFPTMLLDCDDEPGGDDEPSGDYE